MTPAGSIGAGPIILDVGNGEHKRPDIATTSDGTSHIAFEWWGPGIFHVKYVVLNSNGQVVRSLAPGDFDLFGADKYASITLRAGR